VTAALYVAGRRHQPGYSFSLFGADPVPPKSLLATIVPSLAVVQVLLALWMYRKLPLAGRPLRPVPVTHRVTGFALAALTVPVAVRCLIAYGVQLTSPRVPHTRSPAASSTARSPPKCCSCAAGGCRDGRCRPLAGCSRSSPTPCGTARRCGTTRLPAPSPAGRIS
jgi:hypothetical protein